jgi:hypothetical protein
LRLGLALDLDEAGAAGGDRLEQRVVAEPGDLDADLFGGADDQRALGHDDVDAVDGHRHEVGGLGGRALRRVRGDGHRVAPAGRTVDGGRVEGSSAAVWSRRGTPREVLEGGRERAWRSIAERAERAAEDLAADLLEQAELVLVPWPASNFSRVPVIQPVPSRHGVHLPQDSWA